MIFANLWCFGWVLDLTCRKSGGELNALLRTTVAFTQMSGSKAPNVIPPSAFMVSNIRLNPEDSVDSAVEYIRRTIGDREVKLTVGAHMEPSPISRTDCEGWHRVVNAVSGTWQKALVAPLPDGPMLRPAAITETCPTRCTASPAMDLSAQERGTIHGNNERIRLEVIHRAVEFFIRLMKQC